MTTSATFSRAAITLANPLLSRFKTLIESTFYGNNVEKIRDLKTAYRLAEKAMQTTVTDMPVMHPHELGLPPDAKILVSNDGKIVGRTAAARRIMGQPGMNQSYYEEILREAIYQGSKRKFYSADVLVGLDTEFMVQAHLNLAAGFESNLYSYLLNFQIMTAEWDRSYQKSIAYPENDLFIYADPEWSHPDFPNGLALFDPEHNVAAILGLRYFGELKKATLTLAWATAHRHGFIACHGGMKQYQLPNRHFTMATFGLSGSGKSTITLAKPAKESPVFVLHDDAFVINRKTGTTTALEPAYFDKLQDYPLTDEAINYVLTCQNVGVTFDEQHQKVLVTQDLRNGNGRCVKSRYATDNRVDHLAEKIDALFWIMKDDSLPPVVRVDHPTLAAVFGVTLATKRSNAENVIGELNQEQLVIVPFANPFRCYPLGEDYAAFQALFDTSETACYILNTGYFNQRKITPAVTLAAIEAIAEETAVFQSFASLSELSYLSISGYEVDETSQVYLQKVKERMQNRLSFIQSQEEYHRLPEEAQELMANVIQKLTEQLTKELV